LISSFRFFLTIYESPADPIGGTFTWLALISLH
jgi:hypothetical protein